MGLEMLLNVFETINHLEQGRYRTAIFHTTPDKSPLLSTFCQKVCQQSRGKYLDLLEFFIEDQSLSEKIDRFGPEKFRELLIEQSQGHSLLIVDRADFLLDTWRRSESQDFFRFIADQWDSYKQSMKTKLVIVLQTSPEIESLKILDSQNKSRIFSLNDFKNIE